MNKNDISRILNNRQTGEYTPTEEEQQILNSLSQPTPEGRVSHTFGAGITNARDIMAQTYGENYGDEALRAGWGESRFDRGDFAPEADIENRRAHEQRGLGKIANGTAKGVVRAATTAVTSTAGLIDGLLEGGYEFGRQLFSGEDIDGSKVIAAGVNNYVSTLMHKLDQFAEESIPNYRTSYERSSDYKWWQHLLSANTVGDFISNMGFTVGAILGGAGWAKLTTKAAQRYLAGNLMRGITAGVEGDAAAQQIVQDILIRGASERAIQQVTDATLRKSLEAAGKSITKAQAMTALAGSVLSAAGEGTVEGISARSEFVDEKIQELDRETKRALDNVEAGVLNDNRFSDLVMKNDGERVSYQLELNDDGRREILRRKQEIHNRYQEELQRINEEGDYIAEKTYLLNIPILTASNLFQFGKLYSGGWKTARRAAKVAGGMERAADGTIQGAYRATGNTFLKGAANTLERGMSEAAEEMLQGFVSSGSKAVADARMTAFNDDAYDLEQLYKFSNWVGEFVSGGSEYLSDVNNWQEGFFGLVTGLIPMGGWRTSGITGAFREASQEKEASQRAAERLNAIVSEKDFMKRLGYYIRDKKYESESDAALIQDDQYTWQTAESKRLVNTIMSFANAGRLQDLYDLAESYSTMSDDEMDSLGLLDMATTSATAGTAVTNNPAKIAQGIRDNAKDIKTSIEQYRELYDDITALTPQGASEEQIEELTAAAMNVKMFEQRYLSMLNEVIDAIRGDVLDAVSDATGDTMSWASAVQDITKAYSKIGLPMRETEESRAVEKLIRTIVEAEVEQTNDSVLKKKVEDMTKVSDDRRKFVNKIFGLIEMKPETFNQQATNTQQVVTQAQQQQQQAVSNTLNTLDDVKNQYFNGNAKERASFMKTIASLRNSNPAVREFLEMKDLHDKLSASLSGKNLQRRLNGTSANPQMVLSLLDDVLRNAKSKNDLTNLSDSLFRSFEELRNSLGVMMLTGGVITQDAYDASKTLIRDVMNETLGLSNLTGSRNAMPPTAPNPALPPKPTSTPAPTSASAGTSPVVTTSSEDVSQSGDSSTRGSVTPAPVATPAPAAPAKGTNTGTPGTAEETKTNPENLTPDTAKINYEKFHKLFDRLMAFDGDLRSAMFGVNGLEELVFNYNTGAKSGDFSYEQKLIEKILSSNASNEAIKALRFALEQKETAEENNASTEDEKVQIPEDVVTPQEESENDSFDDYAASASNDNTEEIIRESAAEEYENEEDEDSDSGKTHYYRTSVFEIDYNEADKAREALLTGDREAYSEADLSDFVIEGENKNDSFREIWNALHDEGAFDTVATEVNVGDDVEFIITDRFPKYKGQPQILMTVMKDGKRKIVSVLSLQEDKYAGLKALREKIMSEYESFKREHPGEDFVFGKKSKVWATRSGLIDYGTEERSITDIDSYNNEAPILYINRERQAVIVRGDDSVLDFVPESAKDSENNGRTKVGNMYYLVRSGDSSGIMIPIALRVKRFSADMIGEDNPMIQRIRDRAQNIASIARMASSETLQQQQAKLIHNLSQLAGILDLRGITVNLSVAEDGTILLNFIEENGNTVSLSRDEFGTREEFTAAIVKQIASYNRHFNIRQDDEGGIKNLKELIDSGLITSNANKLRPKGVDMYIYSWDSESGEFRPYTETQYQAVEEQSKERKENTEDSGFLYAEDENVFEDSFERKEEEEEPVSPEERIGGHEAEIEDLAFGNLSEEERSIVRAKGISEEEFNRYSRDIQEKLIRC